LNSIDDLLDAFAATVDFARECGAETVYALGHSMGAVTALCAAARDPEIAGVVSIATGYGRPAALAALAGRGVVDLRSSYVDGLTLLEVAGAWEALLPAAISRLVGRPSLFIAAESDGMVSAASVRELFARAPEPKSFESIPGNHTNAAENSRGAILAWLGARHPRSPLAAAAVTAL
jgi:pimeloyl-ACP methyl ester carboxylesterase